MSTIQDKIIPLSKIKISLMFLGSLIFVGLGIWLMNSPEKFISILIRNERFIIIVGAAGILFFGLCAIVSVLKLFDRKPGLIIRKDGMIDNSSGISTGLIKWHDINKVSVLKVAMQRIILLHVKNPQEYIDRQTNKFKKKLMQINYNTYKTPLNISANGLKCSFKKLLEIIEKGTKIIKQ